MVKIKNNQGFTLIEMIVSVSLFVVVALIVSGVFVTIAKANRQSQAIRVLSDNISFVLDTMSYNLKLGGEYSCPQSTDPCERIEFVDLTGSGTVSKSFSLVDGQVLDYEEKPLTTDNIKVTYLDFDILNQSNAKPLVRIFLVGEGFVNGKSVTFSLQTAVSQRNWVNN